MPPIPTAHQTTTGTKMATFSFTPCIYIYIYIYIWFCNFFVWLLKCCPKLAFRLELVLMVLGDVFRHIRDNVSLISSQMTKIPQSYTGHMIQHLQSYIWEGSDIPLIRSLLYLFSIPRHTTLWFFGIGAWGGIQSSFTMPQNVPCDR